MAADPERAAAIEGSVARTLRYALDELSSGPDRTASKLSQAATQLDSSDAKEHLSPETIARFRDQIADLQKKVEEAERREKAERIERDVKRFLSNLADEIQSNGSQIDSYFERAEVRLTKDDARECLTPEAIAGFQAQLAELGAKIGRGGAPAVPTPAAAPAPPASQASVSGPPPAPPAASAPAPAATENSEEAQRIKSSIDRTLRLAEGDIDSPGWQQIASKLGQAETQIDGATQVLSASTVDGFRARLASLQAKFDAHTRAERAEEIEKWLQRLVRDAEQHVDWPDRIGGMLEKVTDVLEKEETTKILPADRSDFYRKEVARIESMAGGSYRQKAIDDAITSLEPLEEGVKESSFEGLSEYEAGKVWGDFEILENRVGYALEKLDANDDTARELRSRLAAVVARRAAAYAATRKKTVIQKVTAAWDEVRKEIAGWEDETQDTSAEALGSVSEFHPKTRVAVRKLRDVLQGSGLFSPIPEARKEYADDPDVMRIVKEGEDMIEKGLAKMATAFDAIMDAAEQLPTPTGEFELRKSSAMAQTAREAFDHTPYASPRVERATALGALWESTLERAREETEAYYSKLTAEAAKAWPKIASAIKSQEGFDPSEPSWRGKTVRIDGFRNRVGWDFGGDYHLSFWVNAVPVAGDFAPNVLAAFQTAQEHGRMGIDDHTDWDAIVEIGGPGKVRQRVKSTVKKDGKTIGEIEEMRPVDCVMCRVIALRAGPVAVGPE
jgi:hypothetical protein